MPGNDQQLQQLVNLWFVVLHKQSWKNLQNEYDELKEIVTKSKMPILTNKKQTNLIRRFLASEKKVRTYTGLLNKSAFYSLPNLVAHKAQIMNALLGYMW